MGGKETWVIGPLLIQMLCHLFSLSTSEKSLNTFTLVLYPHVAYEKAEVQGP